MNSSSLHSSLHMHFSPAVEPIWLWVIGVLGVALLLLSLHVYRRGVIVRSGAFLVFMLALLNPSLIQEERSYVKDVGIIVVDESHSQTLQDRGKRTAAALRYLENELSHHNMIEYRVIKAPQDTSFAGRTDLFSALDQALSDVPKKRRAGVVFITDGRVHDAPKNDASFSSYGPVHALLTGTKNERDRRIAVTHAPAYGLVGKDAVIKFSIEDTGNIRAKNARVTLTKHNGDTQVDYVEIGKEHSFRVSLENPSQNIFTLEVEHIDEELTYANNKTAVIINGVRDRLKVLLVSGIPHTGERTWRDLLTSDPGVDLVHFTILREPDKFDYTPKNELSLIAFPFQELFEVKLYDFDLIIFDRYRVNNILPRRYFENIARYVREGGAFLEASGPAFAGDQSIYDTPLGGLLPARPTGEITENGYRPQITELGQSHPVTQSLVWNKTDGNGREPDWGKWLRYINIEPMRGDTLMQAGNAASPLLVLDRAGKGRVAQISSDHIWLWSRGYDGGGPHAELLRRIVHWLMKEPELDERAMDVTVSRDLITVAKRQTNTNSTGETVAMTLPSGDLNTVDLQPNGKGMLTYKHSADEMGIYAFEDVHGTRKLAMVGDLTAPEMNGVSTTDTLLKPIVDASGGSVIWLDDKPQPVLRFVDDTQRSGGSNWIGFKRNKDYTVTGVRNTPILPEWVVFVMLFFALIYTWWAEGRQRP